MSAQISTKKRRIQYNPQQMSLAIAAVRNGMAKKAAARLYQVPKTTLLDKLAGRGPEMHTSPGKKPTLTPAEETTLVKYAKLMCEIGYPLTSLEFRTEVKRIMDIDGRKNDFKDNLPGRQWMSTFTQRHPEVSFRKPMSLGHERACITIEMIENWYTGLMKYLAKEVPDYDCMIHDPRRIFNADESGFPLAAKTGKVLAPTGSRNVYQVVTNTKTQITVLACLNAYGHYMSPMILFPGERLRNIGMDGFPAALFALTKNGWMDSDAFVEFLEQLVAFAKSKQIKFPILLIVDGHSTHMSLRAAEYCSANEVVLYCLLPNATHVLQACDVGLFSPLKSAWQKTVKRWQMFHIGECLTKKDFPGLFKQAWDQVTTMENAANAFRRSGLFPLSIEGIDRSKLGPSKMIASPEVTTEVSPEPALPVIDVQTADIELETVQVAAYEEVGESTRDDPPVVPIPSTSTISETQSGGDAFITSIDTANSSPPVIYDASKVCHTADHDYVSPAFACLKVPEPKQKKQVNRIRDKLPKALSGSEALRILREREEKKKAEEEAKQKRKKAREEKKIKKQEEAERKRKERELKKQGKELKGKQKGGKKVKSVSRKRKQYESSSESDQENEVPYMDAESDDYEEDFEVCPRCCRASGHPSALVTCEVCLVRWHIVCADRPEFLLLYDEGRRTMEFICPDCE